MVDLIQLWLPILLSAVFVFIVSSIIHMATPFHNKDFSKLPGEEAILEVMRRRSLEPGAYVFPCADSMKEMCTPEMVEKYDKGPVGILYVKPNGPVNMGKHLTQWFLYSVLVGIFVGYASSVTLTPGAAFMSVFRAAGTTAMLAYVVGNAPSSIWKGQPWSTTFKLAFDGLIYSFGTGILFAWLWPGTPVA